MASIDVVVPCYRYAQYLPACVHSLLSQAVEGLRVLIIDDASPDNTVEVAEALARAEPRVTVMRHPVNRGHIATYNVGIDWASAEYTLLLSADDYVLPGALQRAIDLMDSDPSISFTFGNYLSLDANGHFSAQTAMATDGQHCTMIGTQFVEQSGSLNIVATPTAVVRTQWQKRLGGYRPDLPHTADMEMWLRLAAHGKVGFINAAQAVHRQHGANMSRAYMTQKAVLDLEQRRLCFDRFFAAHETRLGLPLASRQRIYRSLSCDAIRSASWAFNDGQLALCDSLLRLAVAICPQSRGSAPWWRLALKRSVGPRAWRIATNLQAAMRGDASVPDDGRREPAVQPITPEPVSRPNNVVIPARSTSAARVFSNVLLSLQRKNIQLPEPIKSKLRKVVDRVQAGGTQAIEPDSWDQALIPGTRVPSENSGGLGPAHSALRARANPMGGEPLLQAARTSKADATASPLCLLVTSSLDVGGMDEVVAFLARRLPQHGVRTAVLHAVADIPGQRAPTGRLAKQLLAQGIRIAEQGTQAAAQWINELRPDVISAHDPPAWMLELAHARSIPYVETIHGMHSLFNTDWQSERRRSDHLTGIVVVSDLVREQYLRGNSLFPNDKILTIPNGVDDERRAPVPRDQARACLGLRDEFLFVCLARHCLQKNTYGLVTAFDEVASMHSDAHLVIAGRPDDSTYFAQVSRLRDRSRSKHQIHLRDHTSDPALLLSAADGFVLNSFFEGWSLASMEALHAGVPVVLSDVGGSREQVGDQGKYGHLVPNPLGDPLNVNWHTIRRARFTRQSNRESLVEAMHSLIRQRVHWSNQRDQLMRDSARRFDARICLRRHATVLCNAAQKRVLSRDLDI